MKNEIHSSGDPTMFRALTIGKELKRLKRYLNRECKFVIDKDFEIQLKNG